MCHLISEMKNNQRIVWLDAIKGCGIILVMISHVTPLENWGTYLFSSFMPLFFICSGFVAKDESIPVVLNKKLKSLLIPYWFYGIIATIFFSIVKTANSYQGGSVHEWWWLVYSRYCFYCYGHEYNLYFMPIESTSPLWFLTALFLGSILSVILLRKKVVSFWGTLFFYIIFTLALSELPILLPWSLDVAFLIAIFMLIGHLLRYFAFTEFIKRNNILIILLVVAYIILTRINGYSNLSVREYGKYGIYSITLFFINGVLFFFLMAWVFISMNGKLVSIFALVGKHSLRLMCIHIPILFCINKFSVKILKYEEKGITIICLIVISLIISILLDRLFNRFRNKFPYLKYL